jgi:hypothetical protein
VVVDKCANLGIATKADQGEPLQACSACAGDYEDPDRSAAEESEDEIEEQGTEQN